MLPLQKWMCFMEERSLFTWAWHSSLLHQSSSARNARVIQRGSFAAVLLWLALLQLQQCQRSHQLVLAAQPETCAQPGSHFVQLTTHLPWGDTDPRSPSYPSCIPVPTFPSFSSKFSYLSVLQSPASLFLQFPSFPLPRYSFSFMSTSTHPLNSLWATCGAKHSVWSTSDAFVTSLS